MSVCREAVAVAEIRLALAHVLVTGVDVVRGIHALCATLKDRLFAALQRTTHCALLLVLARGLSSVILIVLVAALPRPTHAPRVGKLPHARLVHVDATSRAKVIPRHAVVIATEATQAILVRDWSLDLQKVRSVPE